MALISTDINNIPITIRRFDITLFLFIAYTSFIVLGFEIKQKNLFFKETKQITLYLIYFNKKGKIFLNPAFTFTIIIYNYIAPLHLPLPVGTNILPTLTLFLFRGIIVPLKSTKAPQRLSDKLISAYPSTFESFTWMRQFI